MLATFFARLLTIYRAEPVRVNVQIVNLIVLLGAYFNFVIDPESVWQVLGMVGVITGFGELARRDTTPYRYETPIEVDGNPDDD